MNKYFDMINNLDISILKFLNSFNFGMINELMKCASNKYFWIPFYLFFIYKIYKLKRNQFVLIMILICLLILSCDQISSHLIKNVVQRLRPCENVELNGVLKNIGQYHGQYGFLSSHASNTFGLAAFLNGINKKKSKKKYVYLWASIIGLSRCILGVHYPSDVLCGGILGICIGKSFSKLFKVTSK